MPRILSRALVGAALIVFLFGAARAETQAGKVVAIAGECFVQSAGTKTALKMGAAVNVGEVITTADTAKLKIRMNDGSIVSVASGSNLTVNAMTLDAAGKRENVEIGLGEGLIRAVVAPVNHPTTFEVKTATGTAAVRSTDWFAQATPGLMEVAVLKGGVSLMSGSTGQRVLIAALHTAKVAEGHDPTDPVAMKAADFGPLIAATEIAAPRPTRRSNPRDEYRPQREPGDQGNPYQGNPYQGNPYQGGPRSDQGGPPPDSGGYGPPIGTQFPPPTYGGFGGTFGRPSGGGGSIGTGGGFTPPAAGPRGGTTGGTTTTGGSPTTGGSSPTTGGSSPTTGGSSPTTGGGTLSPGPGRGRGGG